MKLHKSKLLRTAFSVAYFILLIYIVFFARRRRNYYYNYKINFIPLKKTINSFLSLASIDKNEVYNFYLNLFGNIFLFIPVAIILITTLKVQKLTHIILWALLLSTLIEIIQHIFHIGLADIDDIILNLIGSVLGFFINKLFLQKDFLPVLK